jgi:hypothetical protein
MSVPLLRVPHFPEAFEGGCLPACCQMVLAYLGDFELAGEAFGDLLAVVSLPET